MNWLFGYGDDYDYRHRLSVSAVRRLILAFGVTLVPLAPFTPVWALAAAAGLCYWRDRLHRLQLPVPSVVTRMVLALIFVIGAWQAVGTAVGREAGTVMVIGLTGIKFLELTTVRDYMVLSCVLYLLLMLALLFEQTVLVFAYVVMAYIVVTAVIYRLNLDDRARPGWRQMARRVGALALQALPVAVVLFLIFPRFDSKFGFDLGLARTGLSDAMSPGSVSQLVNDDSVAFRAEFLDGEKPAGAKLYWRVLVHEQFDAELGRWYESAESSRPTEEPVGGTTIRQRVTVYPHGKRWLFALDVPNNVQPAVRPGSGEEVVSPMSSLVLRRSRENPVIRKTQYEVTSQLDAAIQPLDEARVWENNLQIGNREALSPEMRKLALSLRGNGRSDAQVVDEALRFFRREGFEYTTQPPAYYSDSPTEEFLLKGKRGFCEHFASGFALLMRLNGIPARVVAGYQGGEYNPYGDFYIVRQSDAHAWTEVYLPPRGWVRVDPTMYVSPARIIQGAAEVRREQNPDGGGLTLGGVQVLSSKWMPWWLTAMGEEVDMRFQQVEEIWDRWVLSYDSAYRANLLYMAGLEDWEASVFLTMLTLSILLCLGLAYLSVRRGETRREPLAGLYDEFNRTLSRQGVARQPWEGPLHYAARASQRVPWAAAAIGDFAEAYARVRYGRGTASEGQLQQLREVLARVRQDIARGPKKAPAPAARS